MKTGNTNALIKLAWRSIWRHKRRTLITIFSIAAGLTFATFFICIALGTYKQLIDDAVRMQAGHVTLEHPAYRQAPAVDLWVSGTSSLRQKIDAMPEVEMTKPLILAQGVAKSGIASQGVAVIGIEPRVELKTSPLPKHLASGVYLKDEDTALAVIGSELAKHLNLAEGKKFVITTSDVNGNLVEELLRVKGIFKTGSEEVDAYLIQIPLNQARKIYGMPADSVTELGVLLKNGSDTGYMLTKLRNLFSHEKDLAIYPWKDILPEVAAWIQLDRTSNFIFQTILLFLVLLTIFNTIFMSVLERQREFAVLLAVGTTPRFLRLQIFFESAWVGAIGAGCGMVSGGLVALAVKIWGIDLRHFYSQGVTISGFALSPILRAHVTPLILLTLGGIVFFSTLLVSIVPIVKSVRISMVDFLRA